MVWACSSWHLWGAVCWAQAAKAAAEEGKRTRISQKTKAALEKAAKPDKRKKCPKAAKAAKGSKKDKAAKANSSKTKGGKIDKSDKGDKSKLHTGLSKGPQRSEARRFGGKCNWCWRLGHKERGCGYK